MAMQIEQCKREIAELTEKLAKHRDPEGKASQRPMADLASKKNVPKVELSLKQRRVLQGHFGKVYATSWCYDNRHLVSAAQDGKLIIWNAFSTNKVRAIRLQSSWVMTCAYSHSGRLVASGGLDNTCTIYRVPQGKELEEKKGDHPVAELRKHEGYLSCCRFVGDDMILTASGDATCILWDVEGQKMLTEFSDHKLDVMSVSLFAANKTFVSGSVDCTAKLWDWRDSRGCVKTFEGHTSDVNSVCYFTDSGVAFATGCDDSLCRLFDIRAYALINQYGLATQGEEKGDPPGVSSVCFSRSGKFLFAGCDDSKCYVWDTQHGTLAHEFAAHDKSVSTVAVSEDGKAIATGSWDTLVKIWAPSTGPA